MCHDVDYLVAGAGLTGATIARLLFDRGYNVLVLDRRKHMGGNVHDHIHASGIRIHTYGPHYFRTSSEEIWQFVNRFASFYNYVATVKSLVDGAYENWPVAASYIQRNIGACWQPSFTGKPGNFEESALSLMPELIYHKFIYGYNLKQWGIPPCDLSPGLIKRFDVRQDDDERLTPHHKYQGIPEPGYTAFMQNMLKGIPVLLNTDYLKHRNSFTFRKMLIYTGPIDEFFDYDMGKLLYRGQQRMHTYLPETNFYQPCGQINNPSLQNGPHIRTMEWKHMMPKKLWPQLTGTVITHEIPVTPKSPEDYEYPFPDAANEALAKKYCERAACLHNVLICGRLGEYRYFDMDQAIGRAHHLVKCKILPKPITAQEL